MNPMGLFFVLAFAVLIAVFTAFARRRRARPVVFRVIDALHSLPTTVGLAVETGRRLHLSLGSGSIGQADTAATLAGLTVLKQVSAVAAVSDKPPVVTTADGAAMVLAQDTLRGVYAQQNALGRYDPDSAQVAGLDPLSFGAALTSIIHDESAASTVLVGSVGSEGVLLAEASARAGQTTLAGSDDPAAQALLFAAADYPLLGEDLYAGGAYIGRTPGHVASLRAQDVLRLVLMGLMLLGVLARTAGIDLAPVLGIMP